MANEKRLIDANDVYSLFDKNGFARLHVADIDTIPRVDAVEVVHGRWKPHGDIAVCNLCNSHIVAEQGTAGFHYCPNCGAKMDGGNKDG